MEDLSIDEIITTIEDAFDASIAPKKVQRVDNNKLHLIFKADAAGYQKINKAVLSLKQRFDPALCDDADLPVTASIVGTEFRSGKCSMVAITASNVSETASAVLAAGTYQYVSSSGEVFSFTVALDLTLAALGSVLYKAASANIGSFPVADGTSIAVYREDRAAIDGNIVFSCSDNSTYLGYGEETPLEFRKRILSGIDRQDEITEIEEALLALPTIFECNCVFNESVVPAVYDGVTLAAKELLITITGVPSSAMAEEVAARTCYATHKVNDADVVYYESAHYIGGKYPVYFRYHSFYDYTIGVSYTYDSSKVRQSQVEAALDAILLRYKVTNKHVNTVTSFDIYADLSKSGVVGVEIKDITMQVGGTDTPYVTIPLTRLPRLTSVVYTATDVSVA